MRKILTITSIIILLYSCSNELGRNDAKEMILQQSEYPSLETTNFPNTVFEHNLKEFYSNVINEKLVKHAIRTHFTKEYYVRLTNTGKAYGIKDKYNSYKVVTSILDFKEITGIKFNDAKNQATVDYSLIRKKKTPFSEILGTKNQSNIINKTAYFELYDDGWRIKSKPEKTTPLKDNLLMLSEIQNDEIELQPIVNMPSEWSGGCVYMQNNKKVYLIDWNNNAYIMNNNNLIKLSYDKNTDVHTKNDLIVKYIPLKETYYEESGTSEVVKGRFVILNDNECSSFTDIEQICDI